LAVTTVKEGTAPVHRIGRKELQAFGEAVFRAAGSNGEEARIIAAHLVEANLAGHDSHGVLRIYKYVDWVKAGQVIPNRHADIVSDRGAALVVDGAFGYGQVIGKEAMAFAPHARTPTALP
jgi:uncharacterized oxidoreductase